jgi:hypothetical protein
MLTSLLLCSAALLSDERKEEPDLIRLNDGKRIECRVLFEGRDKVVYRSKKKNHEVAPSAVAEIRSVERSLKSYLEKLDATELGNAHLVADIATWAEANGLPGEARVNWIRVLLLDPTNERAWTLLGGVQQKGEWKLKVKGRFYTIDELRKRTSEWKTALELPTAHFLLRTDGDPERALAVATDVERAWLVFYEIFAAPMSLYVFEEVPELDLVTDPKDYPSPPAPGMSVWFEHQANVLHVNVTDAPNRTAIAAEFCELLIFNAMRRTLDQRTGQIDAWARSGLSWIFGFGLKADPGRAKFDFSQVNAEQFRLALSEKGESLSLQRIVGAGRAGFEGTPSAERDAAAAYTLTCFLVFHEEGKRRAKFAEYLREAFLGRSGVSRLCKVLEVEAKQLEAEWQAYVRSVAGS